MNIMPAIYNGLSDEAKSAYARWNDALLEKADHVIGCRECSDGPGDCGAGIALYEAEQQRWSEWNELRRQERGNVS